MHVTFDTDGIAYQEYPFPPSSIYPQGRISYPAIRDVDPSAAPPEIRTDRGETLFLSAEQADAFRDAIANAALTVVQRVDVWDLLLEPFLDTEFTVKQQDRTLETLGKLGVPREEVSRIRHAVESAMYEYNSLLWDWTHLGLFDLLTALHRLSPERYRTFYWESMELADRGRNGQ